MNKDYTIALVANIREEFANESSNSKMIYNDHPSQKSIDYLQAELRAMGIETLFFGGINELITACEEKKTYKNTLFFNLSNGLTQKSRKGQAAFLLEILNVPYIGSDPFTCLMTANKYYTKQFLDTYNILSPKGYIIYSLSDFSPNEISFPAILKPNTEGSSIGITQDSVVFNPFEARVQLKKMLKKYDEIIIEEYISGYDITNLVIANQSNIEISEVIVNSLDGKTYFDKEVFGIEEKSSRIRKQVLAESILSQEQITTIKEISQEVFLRLNMNDYARFDYRLYNDNLYFLEASPNPVLSETSELGLICNSRNKTASFYLNSIIKSALMRTSDQ